MKKILVIGAGLSGISVCEHLLSRNCEVIVMDHSALPSSTALATGIVNPIVFKRITKSWMVDELLLTMWPFYQQLEYKLNTPLIRAIGLHKLVPSEDYRTMWEKRLGEASFKDYLSPIEHDKAAVKQGALVDCAALISQYREWLQRNGKLRDEQFEHRKLKTEPRLEYAGEPFDAIIFCEGPFGAKNPLFAPLAWKLCKGEWIIIDCAMDLGNDVINDVVNIIPMGMNRYKLSATFEWEQLDWKPTEAGKIELLDAFKKRYDVDVTVVEHHAGVRPTVADRRPYLGEHPEKKGIYIFNGLGTKGLLLAPFFGRHLAEHILDSKPIMAEVDIKRHLKRMRR